MSNDTQLPKLYWIPVKQIKRLLKLGKAHMVDIYYESKAAHRWRIIIDGPPRMQSVFTSRSHAIALKPEDSAGNIAFTNE